MTTSDTVTASLRRLHDRAAQAAARAAAATALMPPACEGADPTCAVAVTLDATGLPTAVRVAADWPRRVGPDAFGAAVTAACRNAQFARLDEWGDRLVRHPLARSTPDEPSAGSGTVTTVEDLQRRLHHATSAPPATIECAGRDTTGRMGVTIGPDGVRGCTADARWVADRSAARLATAVAEAIRQAREERDVRAAEPDPAEGAPRHRGGRGGPAEAPREDGTVSVPTPDQVRVATNTLRAEAERWDQQATVLRETAARATDLGMSGLEAGVFAMLTSTYRLAQAQIAGRAQEAAPAMTRVATTLRDVADTYDREEAANEHRFRNLY
ncbi:hypothetical protein [Pseudonocardia endophytica]|uniref:YbaB/EbfC DNA-binding family protein n=1 Tax=Pseudonocardia endophytica TaxID=401976 RepID=A0A4R1HN88_PSEEN|nr:hypothetical protein [Pseudonocardia endophytica]TCK21820.1 hypothetical protein EV378_5811 [Pseudonocardia endophytica]